MGPERLVGPKGRKRKGARRRKGQLRRRRGRMGEGEGAPSRLCDDEQHADGDPPGDEERPGGTDGKEEEKKEIEDEEEGRPK